MTLRFVATGLVLCRRRSEIESVEAAFGLEFAIHLQVGVARAVPSECCFFAAARTLPNVYDTLRQSVSNLS